MKRQEIRTLQVDWVAEEQKRLEAALASMKVKEEKPVLSREERMQRDRLLAKVTFLI